MASRRNRFEVASIVTRRADANESSLRWERPAHTATASSARTRSLLSSEDRAVLAQPGVYVRLTTRSREPSRPKPPSPPQRLEAAGDGANSPVLVDSGDGNHWTDQAPLTDLTEWIQSESLRTQVISFWAQDRVLGSVGGMFRPTRLQAGNEESPRHRDRGAATIELGRSQRPPGVPLRRRESSPFTEGSARPGSPPTVIRHVRQRPRVDRSEGAQR
jgi:hypothetical protein